MLIALFMSNTALAVHVFKESDFTVSKTDSKGKDVKDEELALSIRKNPAAVTRHLYGIPYGIFFKSPSDQAIIIWAIRNGRYKALEEIFKIAETPEISVLSDKITPKSIVDILKYQEPSTGNTALHYAASHKTQAQKKTDLLLQKIPDEQKPFFICEIKNKEDKSVLDVATKFSKPSLESFTVKLSTLKNSLNGLKVKLQELQESLHGLREKLELEL